ncbi:hypothetical protein HY091_00855, partial [Candidatus Kaiserbacteria bacterium]|nr:hypothetical protein [Candidatus Kaiserbacteria bacterium]
HDLGAYVELRQQALPPELQYEFHKDTTSYDIEDPAFALALREANATVNGALRENVKTLRVLAERYRHTPMLERTHGQGAKVATFGRRVLTWIAELRLARDAFERAQVVCLHSRLSGAIGNYGGGLSPEIEEKALGILGLTPFHGATQIMSRVAYGQLAQSLELIARVLGKIALDTRLGARSGLPLWHEPFGKKQKGSSAMPHKKNTILTEQMTGFARMASGKARTIVENIETWECRDIAQSCVERVEWPDLYHVVLRMLGVMTKVLSGLVVYPDHMLEEIARSGGTYASDEAKNFLAEEFAKRGVAANVAYRIVQLASFAVFEPGAFAKKMRENPPTNVEDADKLLLVIQEEPKPRMSHIRRIIEFAGLIPNPALEATPEMVREWNVLLREVFADEATLAKWRTCFTLVHLLQHEERIFERFPSGEIGM